MKNWHVKVTLEFDIQCNEDELCEVIRNSAGEHVESMDIWDEEFVQFENLGEVEE